MPNCAWMVTLVALTLTACGALRTSMVAKGSPADLQPDEGYLVVAVDTSAAVLQVDLTTDDESSSAAIGPYSPPGDLLVLRVSAATWCATGVLFDVGGAGGAQREFGRNRVCTKVEPGTVAYFGNLNLSRQVEKWQSVVRVVNRPAVARERLARNYPALMGLPGLPAGATPTAP